MAALAAKEQARRRRHRGVAKQVRGTPARPRLSIFRSAKHIYAQVIDDAAGRTLAAASTMDKQLRAQTPRGGDKAAAYQVGKLLGERALAAGIARVVFDRNGYLYHGRVAALAQGAREAGLEF